MENNNQPPFAVGQKVVCVDDEGMLGECTDVAQGEVYTVNYAWFVYAKWYLKFDERPSDCNYAAFRFAPLNPPRVSAIPELLKAPVEETLDVIKVPETIKQ